MYKNKNKKLIMQVKPFNLFIVFLCMRTQPREYIFSYLDLIFNNN